MLFILVVILAFSAGGSSGESLYDKDDPILELDVDTFSAAIYGSKKAHFIEFYSSWCGACIGYAPTFKKFAKQLEKWAPLVQVTVVNCADDKNMPLCREHSVSSYPSLRYFKYNSHNKDDGMKYSGDKYDINKLAHDIAGLAQADAQSKTLKAGRPSCHFLTLPRWKKCSSRLEQLHILQLSFKTVHL